MKKFDSSSLIPLTNEELKETNGGFLPLLIAAISTYCLICGFANIVGRTVAFIEVNLK